MTAADAIPPALPPAPPPDADGSPGDAGGGGGDGSALREAPASPVAALTVEEGRMLDGFLLLAAGGSSSPDDVVSVNLSSLQIVDVADEDLTFFANLDRLDVSDNKLNHAHILRQLAKLPMMASLSLACNSISTLQVPNNLTRLESLDLSFNSLKGDILCELSKLRNLVSLNLASNNISLIPPEGDIRGLQSLEQLTLDSNDLVQFVQWRSLDVLPRLRKLSLKSNRIKRLKVDDVSSADGGGYFEALEDLDLSSNDITNCEQLPVVRLFRSLQTLHLSNNPVMQGRSATSQRLPGGVSIFAQQSKQWYLCGGGCFMRKGTPKEPRLKLNRKMLRRVRSTTLGAGTRQRRAAQLCVYDEEANELVATLHGGGGGADAFEPCPAAHGGAGRGRGPPSPADPAAAAAAIALLSQPTVLSDDLSEGELDQIFAERKANVDKKFNAPVDEPASFMRAVPFTPSIPFSAAAAGLAPAAVPATPVSTAVPSRPPSVTSLGGGGGAGMSARTSSAFFNLTSVGEEAGDVKLPGSGAKLSSSSSSAQFMEAGRRPSSGRSRPPSASGGSTARLQGSPPATPGTVTLPPLPTSSRGSSESGSRSHSLPGRGSLPGGGGAAAASRQPVLEVGVREAMRALRAAALSEYAVAA